MSFPLKNEGCLGKITGQPSKTPKKRGVSIGILYVFFIENWSMLRAQALGGRLAKCCRNQRKTVVFLLLFIENWRILMQNCWGVLYQHVASNEAKILFFCVFFIENSSIF